MKIFNYKCFLILLGGLILFSCGSYKITKRYKKISFTETKEPDEYIDVSAFSFDFNKISTNKALFDLASRGQQELIEQTSGKTKTNAELYNQLGKPFVNTQSKVSDIVHTKFKKRLVISVENLKKANGANRIDQLKVVFDIPEKNKDKIAFSYWDKIVTEYQEIDIGKLAFSKTGSFSISPDITMNGTIEGNTPSSSSFSSTLGEEVNLRKKMASLSGSLTDNQLSIIRHSGPLEDINGNIVIELTLKVKNTAEKAFYELENLFLKGTAVTDMKKIKINKLNYQYPAINELDSDVTLSYGFYFREVDKGANSFSEADDRVVLIKGEKQKSSNLQLLEAEDLKKKFWMIKLAQNTLTFKTSAALSSKTIRFNSYLKAQQFLKWLLITKKTKIGIYQIGVGLNDLKVADIPNLEIEIDTGT